MAQRHKYDYDLVIIGGGSAGIVAGNVAGALGARVALVEKSRIGGECLWTGCVPSKALLHVANAAKMMREAGSRGLKDVPLTRDDCAGAFAYVREKIEEVRKNDATEQMLRDYGVEIFFGSGEFVGPHLFRTPQGDLKGAQFLIATGSSPILPDTPGLADAGFLTNQTLYDRDSVPESLAILGGGYIACEMGQALTRLGCKVTLLERGDCLMKKEDAELVSLLTDVLRGEGIDILLSANVTQVQRSPEGSRIIRVQTPRGTQTVTVAEILAAVGRKANTDGLNLEDIGVTRDDKGNVVVDAVGRTESPHIWAGGDVTGKYQFSHMAEQEAKVLVRNILFPGSQKMPYGIVPWATFTDPELAHVGLTEAEAVAKYGAENIQILRHEFRQDDRAIVEGQTTGLVKVITTGLNGLVLGAHILGPHAGEMIHEWVIALQHKLPIRAIADLVHVYPTVSVSNQRVAQRWYGTVMEKPIVQGFLSTVFGRDPRQIPHTL